MSRAAGGGPSQLLLRGPSSCHHDPINATQPPRTAAAAVLSPSTALRCLAAALLLARAAAHGGGEEGMAFDIPHTPLAEVLTWIGVVCLVLLSGLFAGLTLGFLSMDKIDLEIVMEAGDPESRRCAKKIAPVRADGNLLLCSLLFGNVAVNVLISIIMSDLTSGLVGFFASTILIVIVGDIIPQAICSRYALQVGSRTVCIVRLIEGLLYPIAKPMALLLDMALGEDIGTIRTVSELSKLLDIHVKHGAVDTEACSILTGALNYGNITVSQIMTPMSEAFCLRVDERLDYKTCSHIYKSGFSRVPVYGKDTDDILGLILTKDLILLDPQDATPVRNVLTMFGRAMECLWPDTDLPSALRLFKQGKAHMALVRGVCTTGPGDPYYVSLGIVTLEDVIEYILGDEIQDETDTAAVTGVTSKATRGLDGSRHGLDGSRHGGLDASGHGGSNHAYLRYQRAVSDFGRLRLLDRTLRDEKLDAGEARVACAFLLAHVSPFKEIAAKRGMAEASDMMIQLLEASPVLTLGGPPSLASLPPPVSSAAGAERAVPSPERRRRGPGGEAAAATAAGAGAGGGEGQDSSTVVYQRGKVYAACTLILNGKLMVTAGRDGFQCEAGPWTVLAAEACNVDYGAYTPDFTATVPPGGEPVRCLQISRGFFRRYFYPHQSADDFEAYLQRLKEREERKLLHAAPHDPTPSTGAAATTTTSADPNPTSTTAAPLAIPKAPLRRGSSSDTYTLGGVGSSHRLASLLAAPPSGLSPANRHRSLLSPLAASTISTSATTASSSSSSGGSGHASSTLNTTTRTRSPGLIAPPTLASGASTDSLLNRPSAKPLLPPAPPAAATVVVVEMGSLSGQVSQKTNGDRDSSQGSSAAATLAAIEESIRGK